MITINFPTTLFILVCYTTVFVGAVYHDLFPQIIVFNYGGGDVNCQHLFVRFLRAHWSFGRVYAVFYSFGLRVRFVGFPSTTQYLRKRPTLKVLTDFVNRCKVKFVGIIDIIIPNNSGVLHPVDFFVRNLYEKYNPTALFEATRTYKRTNATLPMKLDQLDKFGADFYMDHQTQQRVNHHFKVIAEEVKNHEDFGSLAEDLRRTIDGDLDNIAVDGSSAAGFPYPAGTKRRTVREEAFGHAHDMLHDDAKFDDYMSRHVWYTTGRAKLQEVSADVSARIICYCGFASMVMAMCFFQPWQRFMNSKLEWCAVGMSWFHGGAGEFARHFGDVKGQAPIGYKYVVIDVKSWDSSQSSWMLGRSADFFADIMRAADVPQSYIRRFFVLSYDMIHAKILMPMGHLFMAVCGMKSGWPDTSNTNTLHHEVTFRLLEDAVGERMKHRLYSDDNFFLAPEWLTEEQIRYVYGRVGLTIKTISMSKSLFDMDFLSKRILYSNGEYFIYRDSVETHARLIMPEEDDPSRRAVPDERLAAERLIGHLFDNPFNSEVRKSIYAMLTHLRDHYKVSRIEVDYDRLRRGPWRNFDLSQLDRLGGVIPVIPSFDFIKELYGVKNLPLSLLWPSFPEVAVSDIDEQNHSASYFYGVQAYHDVVHANLMDLKHIKRKKVAKSTSPYRSPKGVKGFHAARMVIAIKAFDIEFDTAIDLGAHPGACAHSLARLCDDVLCVTTYEDEVLTKMPYVLLGDGVRVIEADANVYVPDAKVDFIHDDCDIAHGRDMHTNQTQGLAMLARAKRLASSTKAYLLTLHEMSPDIVEALHDVYRRYGDFGIIKPHYSNPWKPEYMVCFKRNGTPLVKKSVFIRALNAYLNKTAFSMARWCDVLNANIQNVREGIDVETCPYQDTCVNEAEKWFRMGSDGVALQN